MNEWYLADKNDGRTVGPFSASQMKRLAAARRLLPTDRVRPTGGMDWVPAATIKGLFNPPAEAAPSAPAPRGIPIPTALPVRTQKLSPNRFYYIFGVGIAFGVAVGMIVAIATMHLAAPPRRVRTAAVAQVPPPPSPPVAAQADAGLPPIKPAEASEAPPIAEAPKAAPKPDNPSVPAPPLPAPTPPQAAPAPQQPVAPPAAELPEMAGPQEKIPSDETSFIKQIDLFAQRFAMAPNVLAKDSLFGERDIALQKTLPNRSATNWVGIFKCLRIANSNRDVEITVQVVGTDSIALRTMQVGTGDPPHFETLIRNGTAVHQAVSQLREGDRIVFSGDFVPTASRYFTEVSRESSVDYRGRRIDFVSPTRSMNQPEFMFRFARIAKQ